MYFGSWCVFHSICILVCMFMSLCLVLNMCSKMIDFVYGWLEAFTCLLNPLANDLPVYPIQNLLMSLHINLYTPV